MEQGGVLVPYKSKIKRFVGVTQPGARAARPILCQAGLPPGRVTPTDLLIFDLYRTSTPPCSIILAHGVPGSAQMGAILCHMGALLCHMGAMLCHMGAMLRHMGAMLCHMGALPGTPWATIMDQGG